MNKRRAHSRVGPSFYDNYYASRVGAAILCITVENYDMDMVCVTYWVDSLDPPFDYSGRYSEWSKYQIIRQKRAWQAGRNLGNKAVEVARTSLSQKGGSKVKRKPVRGKKKKKVLPKTRIRKNIKRKLASLHSFEERSAVSALPRNYLPVSICQCTVFLHNSRRKWSTSGFRRF